MAKIEDPDAKFEEWDRDFQLLKGRAFHFANIDDVFWQVHAIIQDNPELQKGGIFQDWIADCYVLSVMVMIRTVVDGRRDSLSFKRLLEDMARNAQILTRDRFLGLAHSGECKEVAEYEFDDIAGSGASHIPKKVIEADSKALKDALSQVKKYVDEHIAHYAIRQSPDEHIAHYAIRQSPDEPALTYNNIRQALSKIQSLIKRYHHILIGPELSSIVVDLPSGWTKVFETPWLVSGRPVPPYTHLDQVNKE